METEASHQPTSTNFRAIAPSHPLSCQEPPLSVTAGDDEEEEDDEEEDMTNSHLPVFRPFTEESLKKITNRIEEEARRQRESVLGEVSGSGTNAPGAQLTTGEKKDEKKLAPNPIFEAGKTLPLKFGNNFPSSLYGKPIEDLDEYYQNKYTFMIVARDKTMFRFSATKALFLFSPFHPVRRIAMYILTHPFFSLIVMIVIMANCVFMAANKEIPDAERAFTGIYTLEGLVKMFARGFILANFTYLRDAWNWLDFIVVVLAYLTMGAERLGFSLGNVAVLRTFRVLRALKTVAVVPGLKTIVGALMEAVRRLRDVMILSLFVLSIFALIGLQLYQGSLKRKCIRNPNPLLGEYNESNATTQELASFRENSSNWYRLDPNKDPLLCGQIGGRCPDNYTCQVVGENPDFGYTNFDNFGWAMLCAFRLMTQDAWENLYQQVLRANGPYHMFFFIIVIFLGSFYLVNVILAIVAMSYDDCQKQDREDEKLELEEAQEVEARIAEREGAVYDYPEGRGGALRSPARAFSRVSLESCGDRRHSFKQDNISMKSDFGVDTRRKFSIVSRYDAKGGSLSLPGSPFPSRRGSSRRSNQFSWRKSDMTSSRRTSDLVTSFRPMVVPCLDNLNVPFADDSEAASPTSDDLNCPFALQPVSPTTRPRLPSVGRKLELLNSRFAVTTSNRCHGGGDITDQPPFPLPGVPPPSVGNHRKDLSNCKPIKPPEPTHFHWNTSFRSNNSSCQRKHWRGISTAYGRGSGPDGRLVYTSSSCAIAGPASSSAADCDQGNGKPLLLGDNPFLCPSPSSATVDLQDVLVLKDLVKHAAGKKKGFLGYEKGMNKKEFLKEKCMQLLFGWECFPLWYKFAHLIELFIMDAFVDLFITLCIIINTVFMAMEHDSMNSSLVYILKYGNYVFTGIFTVEACLKILALGLYKYLQDNWSCFDFVIVILSLVELGLENVKGFSILRSFRLLRVFKLAKSWPTLNLLIGIIGRTMGALGNLCLVLVIIIFIFAVMGMQLFGSAYKEEKARWHFRDFLHSFMIVFRILCGEWIENMWTCIGLNGRLCIPFFLLTMIVGNLVVLNLFLALLLSSFGAESLKHSQEEEGPNKLQEAIDRINRFAIYIKSHITYCFKVRIRHKEAPLDYYYDTDEHFITPDTVIDRMDEALAVTITCPPIGNGRIRQEAAIPEETEESPEHRHNIPKWTNRLVKGTTKSPHVGYSPVFPYEPDEEVIMRNNDDWQNTWTTTRSLMSEPSTIKISKASSRNSCNRTINSCSSSHSNSSVSKNSLGSRQSFLSSGSDCSFSRDDTASVTGPEKPFDGPEINEVNVVFVKYPDDCCPRRCIGNATWGETLERTMVGQIWWKLRCYAYALVEHTYFETFIIIMILASSLALAVEDRYTEEDLKLKNGLKILDKVFTVIFVFEMVVKMGAYGFKKYFTDAWCWLDFIIVSISLIGWFAENSNAGNMGAFRALRTLRALRPLRAVSRWEGMKVVVNALIQAIPAIFNVLLVCLVFWLIFSIMGVNLFSGRFGRCLENGDPVTNTTITKASCQNDSRNFTWFVPRINFDNVLVGYLALFQVATFKGWMPIMYAAIDSQDPYQQPSHENRVYMYLYFVLFIVFGSFFTLNLFIGVIIENFNMQKKKAGGSVELLMTEDQKKYYNAMKKLGSKEPTKPIPKPKLLCQLFFFKLTKNQKFDVVIMIFILLNMMTMAMEHYDEPKEFKAVLGHINSIFIVVFTLEFIIKLLALRQYYFKEPWNVFDFVVVVGSIITWGFMDQMDDLPISPTLLRVIRVFRVGRVLRLVKSAKGIRTLLFSLAVSMPALFNIGLLLFLVMFIYAIVGVSSFMHVKKTAGIDDMFNFETFFNAMIILFQTCTSAGWDMVLAALMNDQPPDCTLAVDDKAAKSPNGDCGNSALAIMYLVSYLVISFLVIINMYIAVILENFSQATEDVQQGLTQDDFDMYYEIWERFDEKATQFISLSQLNEFVDTLEDPLRIPAPNYFKLVSMNIPICEGDRVHCVDILDALTKNFLHTSSEAGEFGDLKKGPEKVNYHPVCTTLKRQHEIVVATLIQRTWRKYRLRRHGSEAEQRDPISVHKKPEVTETVDPTTENNNRALTEPEIVTKPEVVSVDGVTKHNYT